MPASRICKWAGCPSTGSLPRLMESPILNRSPTCCRGAPGVPRPACFLRADWRVFLGSGPIFPLPRRFYVSWAPDGTRVVVGSQQLEEREPGVLALPEPVEPGPVVAVAWAGEEAISECRLEIHDGEDWRSTQLPMPPRVSGTRHRRDALLAPGLRLPAQGALLVGRIPGQACDAVAAPEWPPVWCFHGSAPRCTAGAARRAMTVRERWCMIPLLAGYGAEP